MQTADQASQATVAALQQRLVGRRITRVECTWAATGHWSSDFVDTYDLRLHLDDGTVVELDRPLGEGTGIELTFSST